MATLDIWRRQGIANRITQALIDALTARGAVDIELHATDAGEHVYRSLGFVEHDTGTSLTIHSGAS